MIGKPIHKKFVEDRKQQMIEILKRDDVVGSYLFFLIGEPGKEQHPGFIVPGGLTEDEANNLNLEFIELFGKYAKFAEDRRGKN